LFVAFIHKGTHDFHDLSLIAQAGGAAGGGLGHADGGNDKTCQKGDDTDYDQQFNECEGLFFHRDVLLDGFVLIVLSPLYNTLKKSICQGKKGIFLQNLGFFS
jgi:hypothetical protein